MGPCQAGAAPFLAYNAISDTNHSIIHPTIRPTMSRASAMRRQIEQAGFGLSATHGTSMRPLIWGGRHCVAVAPMEREPEAGELLMFTQRRGEREINIVHRLVEVRHDGGRTLYVTRGDNCRESETVSPDEVVGRVVEVIRTGGFRPWYAVWSRRFATSGRSHRAYTRVWTAIWPARKAWYGLRVRYWAVREWVRKLMNGER